jgi:hypothetical protein
MCGYMLPPSSPVNKQVLRKINGTPRVDAAGQPTNHVEREHGNGNTV